MLDNEFWQRLAKSQNVKFDMEIKTRIIPIYYLWCLNYDIASYFDTTWTHVLYNFKQLCFNRCAICVVTVLKDFVEVYDLHPWYISGPPAMTIPAATPLAVGQPAVQSAVPNGGPPPSFWEAARCILYSDSNWSKAWLYTIFIIECDAATA